MKGSLYNWLMFVAKPDTISKKRFGEIMHDPEATEEQRQEAMRQYEEAGGYENLPND